MSAPLAGRLVVTLAVNLPGPLAAGRLAALGAQVVKVEPPAGDPMAGYSRVWYEELCAGQQVRALDVRSPEGAAELDALLADAAVLITAQRPAALDRLGLGWAALHARHPRLVHVAIVGHPAPHDDLAGHDLTYQAVSGTLSPPAMPKILGADVLGGERAASEALAGILLADATGEGTRREVALSDAAEQLGAPARHGLTTDGILGGALPQYGLYEAADGWVALAALEPHFWERAKALLGVGDSHDEVAAVLRTRTVAGWQAWADEHDIPLAGVR